MISLKVLGDRIRTRREKLRLKQVDLANALGLSPQAISKWERGEGPDIATLAPLARLLGVTVDWLLEASPSQDTFEAAILVTGIHGAHAKALSTTPREFALWANGILHQITEISLAHSGVPVKYMGDQYLCFFSGAGCAGRALHSALQAKRVVSGDLKIGLSHGEIYLGLMGHADYARTDIMGEAVNIAFLTQQWADRNARDGLAVTRALVDALDASFRSAAKIEFGKSSRVQFTEAQEKVALCEVFIDA